MMDQKSWLDATPSRTAFAFGLVLGIGASALAGFALLLWMFLSGGLPSFAAAAPSPSPSVAAQPSAPSAPTGPVTITLNATDHTKGPKDAKVTVVEFSDFQCPYCGAFEPTVDQMLKDYGDKIQFVYRNFPLESIHPNARPAAMAAECASEQGKYWEFHDKLFDNQTALGDAFYQQTATDLKLNLSKFNDCLKSTRPGAKIDADYQSGVTAGVQGTPTTFVDGIAISGAQPYDALKSQIEAALK